MSDSLQRVQRALEAIRSGKMVVLVDNPDRENEGDLCMATEFVSEEALCFMAREGRGLICVSIDASVSERLQIPLQTQTNNSQFGTPFAVSIDHVLGASEGVLPRSRALTMKKLIDPNANPHAFISPGHVFPLVANPAGVIGRQGQTEGSYDLARLAGLIPSGVICEILHRDGTMLRGEAVREFADRHDLVLLSVSDIIQYRIHYEVLVRNVAQSSLETNFGPFTVHVFYDESDQKEHLALVHGSVEQHGGRAPLVRIHSECLTGDVFGSQRCDCGEQLADAARTVVQEGRGVILYLRQEGRGIGLLNKLKAYALQDQGFDTVEANLRLGFDADERDFAVAAHMLTHLGVRAVRLLTNNPEKIETLLRHGITVEERVPLVVKTTSHAEGYMEAKRTKLGHLF